MHSNIVFFFFFNDTATTEIYTRSIVGSVRCVQETANIFMPYYRIIFHFMSKSDELDFIDVSDIIAISNKIEYVIHQSFFRLYNIYGEFHFFGCDAGCLDVVRTSLNSIASTSFNIGNKRNKLLWRFYHPFPVVYLPCGDFQRIFFFYPQK
eukprot:TRINITY_DN38779_c0_g1_i1.p2 TRINITY_DN38779_c0_g1~~TRINITY_DN38779_c0_g1_i1.p2  ORF type:complete len:151 (+),score=28.71 TRINITY_DN38779_c0_g1_i1:59-511(+)